MKWLAKNRQYLESLKEKSQGGTQLQTETTQTCLRISKASRLLAASGGLISPGCGTRVCLSNSLHAISCIDCTVLSNDTWDSWGIQKIQDLVGTHVLLWQVLEAGQWHRQPWLAADVWVCMVESDPRLSIKGLQWIFLLRDVWMHILAQLAFWNLFRVTFLLGTVIRQYPLF